MAQPRELEGEQERLPAHNGMCLPPKPERKACNGSTSLRHQGARLSTRDLPERRGPAELCSRPGPLLHTPPDTILNSRTEAGAQAEGMVSF